MRRRHFLALSTAAAGLSGCSGIAMPDRRTTTARGNDGTSTAGGNDGTSTATETASSGAVTPTIGGSLNGRPYRLADDLQLVEKGEATWLHAFLDVRGKLERNVDPEEDPDVVALRRASRDAGARLVVALQWDFIGLFGDKGSVGIPSPGSARERALFEYATEMLEAIGEPVDVLALGNEPIWESLDEDVLGDDPAILPFTRNLKAHLVDHSVADDSRLIIGAFNRLFNDHVWDKYEHFYRQLAGLARTDDGVDGIDLHIHYDSLSRAESMLATARELFPDGTITVTEISPIWRYGYNKNKPVASFDGGDRFADRYGIAEDVTVVEYLEAAKEDRLSPEEMADFMETMPWYNVNFVEDTYQLFNKYDVSLATIGFLVDREARHVDWTEDWAPFEINRLFQPALIDSLDGAHPHYLDDFRKRA